MHQDFCLSNTWERLHFQQVSTISKEIIWSISKYKVFVFHRGYSSPGRRVSGISVSLKSRVCRHFILKDVEVTQIILQQAPTCLRQNINTYIHMIQKGWGEARVKGEAENKLGFNTNMPFFVLNSWPTLFSVTHTHTHVVQCFTHIIHNTHRHACLMSLLYSPTHTHTHKLFNIQYEHFC